MNALRRLALFAVALLAPAFAPAAASAGTVEGGRAALEASRAAYAQAGAFREILDLELTLSDGRREGRRLDYGVGAGGGAFFALSTEGRETVRIVARDGRMVGLQINGPKLYSEVPYEGDFAAALRRMGGDQARLTTPAPVVARQGGNPEAFLDALRIGILEPLEIAGAQRVVAEDGSPLVRVDLRAANGRLTIGLDAASHRLRDIELTVGEGAQQFRASGTFRFLAGDPGEALARPALAGRTAVSTLDDLSGKSYPLGQPAPKPALPTLDGGTVRLADLAGSVVVLDFWATWCVPCWTALGHTVELAAWAESSGLPVKVFAVDTKEETGSLEEQRRRAADFLRSKGLKLPVLLDPDSAAFSAFHNPGLPSLVIIDPQGRLARYHSGVLPDMVATVRQEVLELLKRKP